MRKTLLALVVLPAVALAQGANTNKDQAQQPPRPNPERMEKRMRLARTLGLAEALDLDTAQALKLGDTLAKFDDRRAAARKQVRDATEVLRNAAGGAGTQKATAADVDGAIARVLDGRAQLQAIDRDMLQAITKDLSPEQKARAALFLGRFRERIERRMWMGPGGGPGMMGPGVHGGHGMGPGNGPGMMDRHPQGMRMGPPGADDRLACRGPGAWDDSTGDDEPPPFTGQDD